ncbi:unnamed protein product [Phytophthora fragariaefolia]|uniref:Unnamed protein product n=1 Tax=Phytophthora fragariaefolia TaxID=1490495 RepID=A0A9W6XGD3_9STRA|nr:unnamed protein product [Phytophthora fragariaefolia]
MWHGCFSVTAPTSSTWLDVAIGGLPRSDGGMAFPQLRVELLAMAEMTVSDWALTGSLTNHVIGGILYPAQPARAAPMVVVTPGHGGHPVRGFTCHKTLWAVGAEMVSKAGAPPLSPLSATIAEVLATTYSTVQEVLPLDLQWDGYTTKLHVLPLAGGAMAGLLSRLRSHTGTLCLEWLPHTEVHRAFPWPAPNTTAWLQQFLSNVAPGRHIREMIRWDHVRIGHLRVTDAGGVTADEAGLLLLHVLAHYPEMVFQPLHLAELRLHATPMDHPLVAQIARGLLESPTATLTLTTNGEDIGTATQISSRPDAVQYLNSVAGSAVHVRDIHPTPILNCTASIWAEKRTWQQKRHVYKNVMRATATGKGRTKLTDREAA